MGRLWKEAVVAYFKVLSPYPFIRIQRNHTKPGQYSCYSSQEYRIKYRISLLSNTCHAILCLWCWSSYHLKPRTCVTLKHFETKSKVLTVIQNGSADWLHKLRVHLMFHTSMLHVLFSCLDLITVTVLAEHYG